VSSRRSQPPPRRSGARRSYGPLAVLCATIAALATVPAVAQAAPPANDDFADAQDVQLTDHVTGTNVDATVEQDEPDPLADDETGHSVWYRFVAAADGRVRIATCDSAFTAVVAVYTGDAVDDLTKLTHSAGACAGGGRAYFTATTGTSYHVQVRTFGNDTGDIELDVATPQPPANDDFEDAVALGMPQSATGANVDATLEPGEPDSFADGRGHSVWYRLTMGTAQGVRIDTCDSDIDTVLGVYTGDDVAHLTEVGYDDDSCDLGSIVDFVSVPGTTYRIHVRGYGDIAGDFKILAGAPILPPPPPPPPPQPTCPPAQSPAGAVVYRGTHSGGGTVCLTVLPTFAAVASFHVLDAPGDICRFGFAIDRFAAPLPIVNRVFSTDKDAIQGAFPTARGAQGVFRLTRITSDGDTCTSPQLTWLATTDATPPWAIPAPPPPPDLTAPVVRLGGAAVQYPLRRNGIVVLVRCAVEICSAKASSTVARNKLRSNARTVKPGPSRTLRLALSPRARRSIRSALRSRARIKAVVAVVVSDAAGNRRTARRTITLRR
jgi:hypothetical protein